MGKRGAGRRLNDQQRMEILEITQREVKVKNVDLAKRYGVSEGAIRKLKQMKDTIRNRYYMGNEHNRDKRKRGGFKRNAPFEEELYNWIVRMRESQPYQLVPLTQTAVRQQAIILSKNYEKMANFKASPGWFARFCSRHRLDPIVAGAGGDAVAAANAAATTDGSLGVPTVALATGSVVASSSADDTAFLMDSLVATPVTTSQAMAMVDAAVMTATTEEESKTGEPSINEQAQLAAREHNEAALRAAAAKMSEAQPDGAEEMADKAETDSEPAPLKKEVDVAEDEMFSLGL